MLELQKCGVGERCKEISWTERRKNDDISKLIEEKRTLILIL